MQDIDGMVSVFDTNKNNKIEMDEFLAYFPKASDNMTKSRGRSAST